MNNMEKLKKLIKEKNGTITTRDLSEHNIARTYLQMLTQNGQLVRVGRGIYCDPQVWDDDMFALQYRFAKGIYSHGTALYLHGLTDRTPLRYEMTFPQGYNPTAVKEAFVKPRTVSPSIYELGLIKTETPTGQEVLVYNIERTLCDLVKDTKTDKQLLLPALKTYVSGRDRNIPKLMQYAVTMKIEKKMRTYLEVLL